MNDYILCIYSCNKNLNYADELYNLIVNRLNNCKIYIIYGDDSIDEKFKIIDDKFIILNCKDDYDSLSYKSILLFHSIIEKFPDIKGIFKCDDDIIPNIDYINNLIIFLNNNTEINYLGTVNDYNNIWINGVQTRYIYCGGPFYYLSNTSLKLLQNLIIPYTPIEDVLIGTFLKKYDIFPYNYKTFSNEFIDNDKYNIHNWKRSPKNNTTLSVKNLYIGLYPNGLGNQLFQIASAYGMAKKHGMFLIILYCDDYFLKHNFLNTIFNSFIYLQGSKIDLKNINSYNDCEYEYIPNLITGDRDAILNGYFQNENYFREYREDLLKLFNNIDITEKILELYPNIKTSYFIHYRRGDYVNNRLYTIDYDSYFSKNIKFILGRDTNANFYILSDDIEYCRNYTIFKNINKEFIENIDALESLYIMSLCEKGGICSNSSFSWWGSYLNTNPEKLVLFPEKWMNINKEIKLNKIILPENAPVFNTRDIKEEYFEQFALNENNINNKFNLYKKNTYAQNGEDGVLEYIFNIITPSTKYFVEFGGWDGIHLSNTANFRIHHKWQGLLLECDKQKFDSIPNKKELNLQCEMVTKYNINNILKKYNVPKQFDLLSIDIDSNDYYVWESLLYRPRIVIVEINPGLPNMEKLCIKEDKQNISMGYFGANLKAFYSLAKRKGYSFLTCVKWNAIFILDEEFHKFNIDYIREEDCIKNYFVPEYYWYNIIKQYNNNFIIIT